MYSWIRRQGVQAVFIALLAVGLPNSRADTAHAAERTRLPSHDRVRDTVRPAPIPHTLLAKAWAAYQKHKSHVRNRRFITIADFKRHSMVPRLFVLDLKTGQHRSLLVAHGQGSDPDHDGFADVFSNEVDSHMSSLGAYVTGSTYHGKHGLSLRLKGLEASNNRAQERAIVIHGAAYVSPDRQLLGRSWGCPAIELHLVEDVLPSLANGSFLFISA